MKDCEQNGLSQSSPKKKNATANFIFVVGNKKNVVGNEKIVVAYFS